MTENVLAIEFWDIDKVKPYLSNAKKHPPESVTKLAAAIKALGWNQPIVVWTDGVIIAGHGRRLAAIELGLKKVPVIVRRDLTQIEADSLRLADNRVVATDYDMALMQEEMRRLGGLDVDLTELGYEDNEIAFVQVDLGAMDDNFFAEDINAAVEEQKAGNLNAQEQVDDTAAPVGDAFGFKRVTIAQSRRIREFMNQIEKQTGQVGIDALMAHISTAA